MAVRGALEGGGVVADEGAGDDARDAQGVEEGASLFADAVEAVEAEMVFVGGDLKDTVGGGVDDGEAGADVIHAEAGDDLGAAGDVVMEPAIDADESGPALHEFEGEAVGEGREWLISDDADHFPVAGGGIFAGATFDEAAEGGEGEAGWRAADDGLWRDAAEAEGLEGGDREATGDGAAHIDESVGTLVAVGSGIWGVACAEGIEDDDDDAVNHWACGSDRVLGGGFAGEIVSEDRAADELAEDGVIGDEVRREFFDQVEEGEEAFGGDAGAGGGFDAEEERLSEMFEDGEFVDECGVEGGVGVFLVGEDVIFFAAAYFFPRGEGVFGGPAAVCGIADDAADEAGVRGRDTVVAVNIELGKGGDVDAEEAVVRAGGAEAWVEAVDALGDDELIGLEGDGGALGTFTGDEIEVREVNSFAVDEGVEVEIKEREVEGIDRFEIGLAEFVAGGLIAVEEVAVHFEGEGADTMGEELDGEAFGEGGFAGGGRAGDEDDFDSVVVGGDASGDISDFAFVEGFANEDGFAGGAVADDGVDLADMFDAEEAEPVTVFAEDGIEFGGVTGFEESALVAARVLEDEASVDGEEGEMAEIAGGGEHIAVEGVFALAQLVHDEVIFAAFIDELDFIMLIAGSEDMFGFIYGDGDTADGLILRDDVAHVGFDLGEFIGAELGIADDLAEIAAVGDRVINEDFGVGIELVGGGDEEEGEGAAVDTDTF